MRERILALLRESKDYLSGQELCEMLSVSRTAVWKAVNSLKAEGYRIEAVRNRGYRLVSSPDVLLSEEIKSLLTTTWWGRDILYFERIDSTNNEIKRQAENGASEGLLVIAEEQTAGRGRHGRSWVSPSGTGIWMSFLLRPHMEPAKAPMITLIAALACAKAIRRATNLDAFIKWPNDIVIDGRKVTGILTEMSAEMTSIHYVTMGIGMNVNMKTFPAEIAQTATSLALVKGQRIARSGLVAAFGKYFEECYGQFVQDASLVNLIPEYEELLVNRGCDVIVAGEKDRTVQKALGINQDGELLVQDGQGTVRAVRAGEVSIRGMYGYV